MKIGYPRSLGAVVVLASGSLFPLARWGAGATLQLPPRPQHAGKRCYFGTLHAHSSLSGDFEPAISRATISARLQNGMETALALPNGPLAAYRHAAQNAKIDFLALTDHVHGGAQAGDSHESMPEGAYAITLAAAERINGDPQFAGKFLATPGMEWSSISSGNHVNLLFPRREVPRSIVNGDFVTLRNNYLQNPNFEMNNLLLCVQMNHPNQGGVDTAYGRRQFAPGDLGTAAFVSDFKGIYAGIEHINNSSAGNGNTAESNAHRDGDSLESDYKNALNIGLRVAPVGDHDNHRRNWGRHTAARTGVWMNALTPAGFAEAYRARRVFATEDNEMSVLFLAGPKWMGETLSLEGEPSREVTFTVRVDQMADTDAGTLQDEGPYTVELMGDEDGIGGAPARTVQVRVGSASRLRFQVRQGETATFTRRVSPRAYYYLHVKEGHDLDGGGNPADAWTAPVFFTL